MSDRIIKELVALKNAIEKAKQELARKEGQLTQIWQQLEPMGIKNSAQLEKRIAELDIELKSLEDKIEAAYKKLREHYEW